MQSLIGAHAFTEMQTSPESVSGAAPTVYTCPGSPLVTLQPLANQGYVLDMQLCT